MQNLYHLLRISLGISPADSFPLLSEELWTDLKAKAIKQTVLGVCWGGIEKLPLDKQPPRRPKLVWLADTNDVRKRNEWMDKACRTTVKMLSKVGLHSVILKGQGIARLYPTPAYRMAGDIDVLVSPCQPLEDEFVLSPDVDKMVKDIRSRIESIGTGAVERTLYHDIEWKFSNVMIEVHHRPMQLNNPWSNKRFQQWTKRFKTEKHGNFTTPDIEFNLVFLLTHLYHHLLFEGVGLRQVCDYVVLLQAAAKKWPSGEERTEVYSRINKLLEELRMNRFAAGFMWIMQSVFALPTDSLITTPDEKIGRFILKEIEQAGNFGHYDDRIDHEKLAASTVGKFFERVKYRMRFVRIFPSEILWDVPFRLWHWTWRLRFGSQSHC